MARLWPILLLFLFSGWAFAWESDLKIPARAAPVVDEFGLLSSTDATELDQIVRRIKEKSGVEVGIYIPSSLQDRTIEDFSIAVAEKWKLGRKKEDKGLLFVIAPKERKMRLEVGYGLEGELTDAYTRRILDNQVRPFFKEGEYARGIYAALLAVQEKVNLGLQDSDAPPSAHSHREGIPARVIFLIFLIIVIIRILSFFSGGPGGGGTYIRRGGWGGGGFGGGSWGGGGGGFGGGGSSSDW